MPSLFVLLAYLIGSIPFGLLAGKVKGMDIRDHGSGNIGATNVFRICGKGYGITVFVLDVLKGLVPVLIAQAFTTGAVPILAGVAAILGHNFPIWLGFKGGKGIATSAGVLGGLLPWALLVAFLTWALTFLVTRYVSLASILAALSLPVTQGVATYRPGAQAHPSLFYFTLVIAVLAVWRHRSNIQRLLDGSEHRFSKKPASPNIPTSES